MKKDQNISRRILITDDKSMRWDGYILFELQRKRHFWSKWITQDHFRVNVINIYNVDYIDQWKDKYPEAEVINNSKNFIEEMKMETEPFKAGATVALKK